MIDRDEAERILGDQGHLFLTGGRDAGEVRRIYLDEYTGWPSFCTIEPLSSGSQSQADRETLVALHEADLQADGAGVIVPYDSNRIEQAPTVGADQDLSIEEEDALFDYYGVPIEGVVPSVAHLGSVLELHDNHGTGDGGGPQAAERADVVEHEVDRPR